MDFVSDQQDSPDFVCHLLDGRSWTGLSWKAGGVGGGDENAGKIHLNAEKH